MQSENYVPGASGWKIDLENGKFELNSGKVTAFGTSQDALYSSVPRPRPEPAVQVQKGSLPAEPQMVTVTAAEWSVHEMPSHAITRYNFIGEAVMKIPVDYRDSAVFSTEDYSYDRDGSDIWTTLTYSRPETPEEASARVERAKVAGTKISITNDCVTIFQDGVVRVRLGDLSQPFVVEGDQVSISKTAVDDGAVNSAEFSRDWSVTTMLLNDRYVCSGIGLGLRLGGVVTALDKLSVKEEQPQSPFEKSLAEGDAGKTLDMLAGQISEADLARGIKEFANKVRKVMADELRPGGLLHRR